jgi:DinB superfamily
MATMEEYAAQTVDQRLDRLKRTADQLETAIRGQVAEVLARRPDGKNWAGVEVLCHLRDTEEAFLGRFEMILAVNDPPVAVSNLDRWAQERQYLKNDAGEAVAAFRARRTDSLEFLRVLTPAQWQRAGIHPVRGPMSIDTFLTVMAWHDDNHLDQLQRALAGKP